EQDNLTVRNRKIDVMKLSGMIAVFIGKRNILKFNHANTPSSPIFRKMVRIKSTAQNVMRTISNALNPILQILVRRTGAPSPRVKAAADNSSPILIEQIIIGTNRYS